MSMMLALLLLATDPIAGTAHNPATGGAGAGVSPQLPASGMPGGGTGSGGISTDAQDDFGPGGLRDQAVPLDWAGPAARTPGADQSVQEFDPSAAILGEPDMCIITRGQPLPACAQTGSTQADGGGLRVDDSLFAGGISNPDATCQTVESVRRGANNQPQRVFATVCGDEAEMWNYRSRSTPTSTANPTRSTDRAIGPNDVTLPESRPSGT
jgi:hypothetical protein